MKKLAQFIIKFRFIIIAVFIVAIVICTLLIVPVYNRVNYDLMSYLPEGFNTNEGYQFLNENFGINGDIEIGLTATESQAENIVTYIEQVDGVTMAMWRKSLDAIKDNIEIEDEKFDALCALFSRVADADAGTNDYVILVTLGHASSSKEAVRVLKEIETKLKSTVSHDNYYLAGTTQTANQLQSSLNEIYIFSAVAGIIVILILLATTSSFIEPIILLLTMVISILINIGTNIIYPSTSIITFACSAILQLGLSMDYAIFLLHAYKHRLRKNPDPQVALAKAIPESIKSIFASALTTIGGFLALYAMRFKIGADLSLVLGKGIGASLVTVIFLQPCLILLLEKFRKKSIHRFLDFKFKSTIKHSIKFRNVIVILFCIVIIPLFCIQQFTLSFKYIKFVEEGQNGGIKQEMTDTMANQVMIAVPNTGDSTSIAKQYEFVGELENLRLQGDLSFILGLYNIVDENSTLEFNGMTFPAPVALELLITIISDDGLSLGDEYKHFADMLSQYVSNGYTLYTVGINNNIDLESEESFAILAKIQDIAENIFCEQDAYGNKIYRNESGQKFVNMTGITQAAADFAAVTPTDFIIVTAVSVILIFLILLFTMKSFKISLIIVFLIEVAIWINLAMQHIFTGGSINFMSYLIISAVQLGATVDYAILITNKYQKYRKRFGPRQSAYLATTTAAMSVLTSASIMAGACFSVFLISTNLVIQEMTFLMARGAIISFALVLFVLPALIVATDKRKLGTTEFVITPELRKTNRKFLKLPKKI